MRRFVDETNDNETNDPEDCNQSVDFGRKQLECFSFVYQSTAYQILFLSVEPSHMVVQRKIIPSENLNRLTTSLPYVLIFSALNQVELHKYITSLL